MKKSKDSSQKLAISTRIKQFFKKLDEFLNKLFDLIFEYIEPEYFALSSACISLITIIISLILYSQGNHFSFFSVYISNIPVGPHGSGIVFGIGTVIANTLMLPFLWAIKQWLWSNNRTGNIFLILGGVFAIIAYINFVMLLFFDMDSALMIHDLSSAGFFGSMFLMSIFLTISMEIGGKASKLQWGLTSSIITLALLFTPWYTYTISNLMFPYHSMSFHDWVQMMGSLDPKMDGVRYFEWMGLIFSLVWIIHLGFHFHYSQKKNKPDQPDHRSKSVKS